MQAVNAEADLKRQMEANRQQEQDRIAQAEKERQAAIAERQAESQKLQEDLERLRAEHTKTNTQRTATIGQRDEQIKKIEAQIAENQTAIKNLTLTNDRLREQVVKDETALTAPDGKVLWVNQPARIVWVNLGEEDAVRPQMTFDVYDVDQNNLIQPNVKGTIEILRVVDANSSEARIRTDQLSNPIMGGDAIDSHIWQRGERLRFALAGMIDIDDDSRNDLDMLADLIKLNGGVIDAILTEQGQVVDEQGKPAEMSIHTRYLVQGDAPSDPEALKGYVAMSKQSQTLGVEEISYTRILEFVDYDGKGRSVALGRGARAADFKAKPLTGVTRSSTGSVSGLYGQKEPPFRVTPPAAKPTPPEAAPPTSPETAPATSPEAAQPTSPE